jgi:ankyrin repeat protein
MGANDNLHDAASAGDAARVAALLDAGADVNERKMDEEGEDVEAMIDVFQIVPARDGFPALVLAAQQGNIEVVRLLLNQGADVNATTYNGWTALKAAAASGHTEILRLLLANGAMVSTAGGHNSTTALARAVMNNDTEAVLALLGAGADVNELGFMHHGFAMVGRASALSEALSAGHSKIAALLIQHGAEVRLIHAVMLGDYDRVKTLLKAGADVNEVGPEGWSPLSEAVTRGHLEIARFLINAGIDITETGPFGLNTALLVAAATGHTKIVAMLIDRGADVTYSMYGTALHQAAVRGHLDTVKCLLNRGANVNAWTHFPNEGLRSTVLMYAVEGGHLNVVRLLLERGADIHAKDAARKTALWYVRYVRKRKREMTALLKKACARCRRRNNLLNHCP